MYFKYKNIMICVIKIENETLTSNKCMHRMEAMGIGTIAGMLKIVGVAVSVGGTMLISLCKGKTLHLWNPIFHHHNEESTEVASYQLRGTILLLVPNSGNPIFFSKKKENCGSNVQCVFSLYSQSKVLKVYPYKYWSSMATFLVGGFQTAVAGVVFRRDSSAWKIGWDINLVTIIYSVMSHIFSVIL
jgi:hypothetical protein